MGTDDIVEYVDVSQWHELDEEPLPGVLVAVAGLALRRRASKLGKDPAFEKAFIALRKHAHGYTEWVDWSDEPDFEPPEDDEQDEDPRYPVQVRGALQPPTPTSNRFGDLVEPLRVVRERGLEGRHCVLLFDSLDRLASGERFRDAVTHDLPVLKRAGIGCVTVGPMRFGLSSDRSLAALFDDLHVVQTANAESADGVAFLHAVLRARAPVEMIPDDAAEALARASGGVVRDLLSLAQRAAVEAYDRGLERLDRIAIEAAIHDIGAAKAIALDARSLDALRSISAGVPLDLKNDDHLAVIERGQAVQSGLGRWTVHPTLRELLRTDSEAA